ncbi:pyridoxal-dependent decarboxylase domain-containing protein 1-like isoform X2 [Brienomyrus brachyistius]|uniref:pyridoxal-dependent decarboxylase domain-containing protein 1-like isoform X2 n=1 Tax=Brienomyrus brachyistius TaxID=42636 RepID=UPI0020B2A389|nr:pyridoxal-dependent decarboxylase domain-containing protein 1-like isoform X2 [Brienomyrus brachyistius]
MDHPEKIVNDPVLNKVVKNLNEAMKILEDDRSEVSGKQKAARRHIPGPLQRCGQDAVSILQLVQSLMRGGEAEVHPWVQGDRKVRDVVLLGHSVEAYISMLDREQQRRLATRVQSDVTLWLSCLFRYENGSVSFHEDDREGLLKVCRLVIHSRYKDFATEGVAVLGYRHPVIYQSSACRPGLGQYLCSQLGLPLSCLYIVPCNTAFGSEHRMDAFLLDGIIKEDVESGKLPLLLIANAGTAGAGHTDRLDHLRDLCDQHSMWLHVEGVNLAMLALSCVPSPLLPATKCDSMTLTLGPWLGLPSVPAVTLYRHEDPALALAAGLTWTQLGENLQPLPLWMSLQYLGHSGIVERIQHALGLSHRLLESLKKMAFIKTSGDRQMSLLEALNMMEDEPNSPVVVFKFCQESSTVSNADSVNEFSENEGEFEDTLNRWLGEQLGLLVSASGLDVVYLDDEGSCVRFNPLMTSALLGTQESDVDAVVEHLVSLVPLLCWTTCLRHQFCEEVSRHNRLMYLEEPSWPGLGAVRYQPSGEEPDGSKRQQLVEKINSDLLKQLQVLDAEVDFSTGPEFGAEKNCIFVGMATEDLDVVKLVDTIEAVGRDIEESNQLLDTMSEVVQRGILEAESQLQKATEEKLMQEGVLRQIPMVASVLNWFSPVQSLVKGSTFSLASGSLNSTEHTYTMKTFEVQGRPVMSATVAIEGSLGKESSRRSQVACDSLSQASHLSHAAGAERQNIHSPLPDENGPDTTLDPKH